MICLADNDRLQKYLSHSISKGIANSQNFSGGKLLDPQKNKLKSAHCHKLAVSVRQKWLEICRHKLLKALDTMASKCLSPYVSIKTIKLLLRHQHFSYRVQATLSPWINHDHLSPMQGKHVHHCTLHKMLIQHSYSPNLNLASHPLEIFGSVPEDATLGNLQRL